MHPPLSLNAEVTSLQAGKMPQNNGIMDSVLDIFDLMANGKVGWLNIVWCFFSLNGWPFILATCEASMKALGKAAKNLLRVPSFLISSLGPLYRICSDVIWRDSLLSTCVVTYRNSFLHSSPVFFSSKSLKGEFAEVGGHDESLWRLAFGGPLRNLGTCAKMEANHAKTWLWVSKLHL